MVETFIIKVEWKVLRSTDVCNNVLLSCVDNSYLFTFCKFCFTKYLPATSKNIKITETFIKNKYNLQFIEKYFTKKTVNFF